jgi:serine/threonine protein kinase
MLRHASSTFEQLVGTTLGNYRLEQLNGQSRMGPIFLVRTDKASTTFLLHILAGSMNLAPKDRESYLERFQYQASQIATLQHPYILPLLDYGAYRGLSYLITPHIQMRSLHTRLAKSGPLDVLTVGRYVDQIATALEYAHEHGVLHGSLSVDCIFIRLDGHLVVADFGVRSLLELNRQYASQDLSYEQSEGAAPEQLLGKTVGTYTDVYALGAVLYHLLTGFPVFAGSAPDELVQQHLYASVPPLTQWRSDLPAGLYSIIARALAKNPAQRFHQPGALANAYHRIVLPNNQIRVPFIVSAAPSVQSQQSQVTRAPREEIPLAEGAWSHNGIAVADHANASQRQASQTTTPYSPHGYADSDPFDLRESRRPALLQRLRRKRVRRTVLITALIVLLVAASSTIGFTLLSQKGTATPTPAGQVTFFDLQNGPPGHSNGLNIVAHGLDAPSPGFQYAAWFINEQTEAITSLGTLSAKGQDYVLNYAGASGPNLLGAGDKLEITLEQGTVKVPAGKVILVGKFPLKASAHIQHVLVSFPQTPGKIGLVVGVLEQTHLLSIQAAVLQNDAASRNTTAIACAAQSIIDLIEGKQGSHYQPLAAICASQNETQAGDGFGLLGKGYLIGAAEHATFAVNQPDATNAMRLHEKLMNIALSNITGWVTTIEQDALHLREFPTDLTPVQEIVRLADNAYHGVDVNSDGQIDPLPGEAGALTAYLQGQLMATLSLTPSA